MKKLVILLLVPLLLFILWYGYKSYMTYINSDYEAEGFFICNKDNTVCELSEHIHTDIEMTVCGRQIYFPKETGKTDKQHTHKEQNKIHWHARERVDPTTRESLDKTPRQLKAFFEQMDYQIPTTCNNKDAKLMLFVNGIVELQGLDYIWKDQDKLKVVIE